MIGSWKCRATHREKVTSETKEKSHASVSGSPIQWSARFARLYAHIRQFICEKALELLYILSIAFVIVFVGFTQKVTAKRLYEGSATEKRKSCIICLRKKAK